MWKIFEAYAQRRGSTADTFRFSLDGNRIIPDDTPRLLELDENDQIDVILHQLGC